MLHQKNNSSPSMRPLMTGDHVDPSSERLAKGFVHAAVSGEEFVDDEHEPALGEEPIVEASYPTSWTWMGRPGDHKP